MSENAVCLDTTVVTPELRRGTTLILKLRGERPRRQVDDGRPSRCRGWSVRGRTSIARWGTTVAPTTYKSARQ